MTARPNRLAPPARRVRRNVAIGAIAAVAIAMIVIALPIHDAVALASMSTAYVATALLFACLMVGPLNVLRRRPNPVSTHLRRDLGIWGGAIALVHLAVGLNVHLRGRPWLYFVYGPEEPHRVLVRHDIFGFANYTGLAAGVIFAVLLAISNDRALRRMGTTRWKRWQRWNYAATALLVAHGAAFQTIEKRTIAVVIVCALALASTIALQLAAASMVRRGER